jgi:DNA-binding Xre family transcriptional regulator
MLLWRLGHRHREWSSLASRVPAATTVDPPLVSWRASWTAIVTQPFRLVEWRHRRPWTQQELATAAGICVGTVRGIEHGYYKSVRPRIIRAIAAALGVEPAEVMEFRRSMHLSSGDGAGQVVAAGQAIPP